MSLSELIAFVRPPASPVNTNRGGWAEVEARFGLTLPADYREYCERCGCGQFRDARTDVCVENLLSGVGQTTVTQEHTDCEDLRADEDWPYAVHPEQPGLFLWARDVDGNRLFWLTEGNNANKWPVMVYPQGDTEFLRFDMTMTTFLAKAFARLISVPIWGPKLFADATKIEFVPR